MVKFYILISNLAILLFLYKTVLNWVFNVVVINLNLQADKQINVYIILLNVKKSELILI